MPSENTMQAEPTAAQNAPQTAPQAADDDIVVEVYNGVSKKSKKPFKALKVQIGQYRTLVFPTPLEMWYIEAYLRGDTSATQLGK